MNKMTVFSLNPDLSPRGWQSEALGAWKKDCNGVVRVVTGGGKTFFALFCIDYYIGLLKHKDWALFCTDLYIGPLKHKEWALFCTDFYIGSLKHEVWALLCIDCYRDPLKHKVWTFLY